MVRELHWRPVAGVTLQITALALLVSAFFVRTPQVSGLSMEPRISPGEFVVINTLVYRWRPPARDDIIAFRHDGGTPQIFIKRVIGIAGDRVRIARGQVYVNGRPLAEPYVQYRDDRSFREVTVPASDLYVLGDNRANSDDSRFWGFVPRADVLGKALAGIWPVRHLGAL